MVDPTLRQEASDETETRRVLRRASARDSRRLLRVQRQKAFPFISEEQELASSDEFSSDDHEDSASYILAASNHDTPSTEPIEPLAEESCANNIALKTADESVTEGTPKRWGELASAPETPLAYAPETQPETSGEESYENRLNAERLRQFKKQYTRSLLNTIEESEFEFGFDSMADAFVRDRLKENAMATKQWLNEVFLEHFSDISIATGILRVISHFPYKDMGPQGPTIALAALQHKSVEVRECGIRAFENWSTRESLKILRSLRCPEPWLADYVAQIIADMEENLTDVPSH